MPKTQTSSTLHLRSGASLALADRLGGGGEGTVHAVQGQPGIVAKIYHSGLSGQRLKKLDKMIEAGTPALAKITAWPSSLLYSGSHAVGFIMPRAAKAEEAHILYGLKSRKQKFPNAGFRFLVHTATNIARAFATVHQHGIVIGDVNERVAMIGQDGTVRLIDCDSFQFVAGKEKFRCEVGVPTFTPPELQQVQSFRGVDRTEQHDAFGLAVLLFHLLFLGRHPYAGRYGKPTDMPIETAIQQNRFAYSSDRTRTLMEPPPNTPQLAYSGPGLAALFEQAFSPDAVLNRSRRPSADQWADALSDLLSKLAPCQQNASHAYVHANGKCPWCAIELNTRIEIFNYLEPSGAPTPPVDIEAIWRAIDSLQPAPIAPLPDPDQLKNGLRLSTQAALIARYRTERQAVAIASKAHTEAAHLVAAQDEIVKSLDAATRRAQAHADAFEQDGKRLLELQRLFGSSSTVISRLSYLHQTALWSVAPAAIGSFVAFQNAPIALAAAGLMAILAALVKQRREQSVQASHRNAVEMHNLRASIDLGHDHRKALVAAAKLASEEANTKLGALRAACSSAADGMRNVEAAATISEDEYKAASIALRDGHAQETKAFEALSVAQQALHSELVQVWQGILNRKREAKTQCHGVRAIEAQRIAARKKAHDDARESQLNDFLDQFFITQEKWPRIPKSALSALSSYGVETAADVTHDSVLKVPGFGAVRTRLLVDWRDRKARGFRFDSSKTNHSPQLGQLERKLTNERRQLERSIVKAKAQIDALVTTYNERIADNERGMIDAAIRLAQYKFDGEALQLSWSRPAPSQATSRTSQSHTAGTSRPGWSNSKPKRRRGRRGWWKRP